MKEKLKKIPPKYIVAGVILIVMLLLLIKHRSIFYNSRQDNYNDMSGEEENIAAENAVISQYFTVSGNMQNIALLMTNDSGEDVTIQAMLRDAETDEVLSAVKCNVPKSTGTEEVVSMELTLDGVEGTRSVYLTLEEETRASEGYYCALAGDYEFYGRSLVGAYLFACERAGHRESAYGAAEVGWAWRRQRHHVNRCRV